jgi:metallophosphoesterase superfamily enzyme
MLPPYDTRETLDRLEARTGRPVARRLVLLGDTFHDRRRGAPAGDDACAHRALALGRDLVWVVGNHDADGPRALPGEVVDERSMPA